MTLDGCVALVTGAARQDGIGYGCVRALLLRGARGVVLTDIDVSAGEASTQSLVAEFGDERVVFLHHDVTSEADWEAARARAAAHFGRLDILINNAGCALPGSIETMTVEALRRGMTLNFESQFIGIKTCAPLLADCAGSRAGGSAIINNSSMAAYIVDPGALAYHISKAAIRMLTMCAAREYGPRRIRVNSVHFGPIMTNAMQTALHDYVSHGQFTDSSAALAGIASMSPLGITGTIEDAGALVAFLASDEARFVTGAAYVQDGGCFMQY